MKNNELTSKFELKSLSEPVSGFATFSGYASVFDYVDSQMDIVVKGAFTKCLEKRPNVKMLWQHNMQDLIGRYTKMVEDSKGLYVEGEICLDAPKGMGCYALMKQGSLDSLSIGFVTKDYEYLANGVRAIKEVDLFEISPVTFPANDMAMIHNVKSIVISQPNMKDMTIKEFERKLREVFNCSQAEAKIITSKGFAGLNHRDGDDKVQVDAWAEMLQAISKQLT